MFKVTIDISNSGIAIVVFEKGLKGLREVFRQAVPLAREMTWPEGLGTLLASAADTLGELAGSLRLGLPVEWFFYRNAVFPFSRPDKIRQALPYTLESGLPLAIDQVRLDFIPLNRNAGQQEVLAAGLEDSRLQNVLGCLAEYQLTPEYIGISGLAAARVVVNRAAYEDPALFLDTGSRHCGLFGFLRERLVLIRGLNPAQPLKQQVQHTLSVFNIGRKEQLIPRQIHIAGPLSTPPDAVGLADGWGGPVEVLEHHSTEAPQKTAHPTRASFSQSGSDQASSDQAALNRALNLALAPTRQLVGLNFSTRQSRLANTWQTHRGHLVFSMVLALLLAVAGMLTLWLETRGLEQQAERLMNETTRIFQKTFPQEITIVDPLQQMRINLREARQKITSQPSFTGWPVVDILYQISHAIPAEMDVELQRFSGEEQLLMISGETTTFSAVETIKIRLEEIEAVDTVTITFATADQSGTRIAFRLRVQLTGI